MPGGYKRQCDTNYKYSHTIYSPSRVLNTADRGLPI